MVWTASASDPKSEPAKPTPEAQAPAPVKEVYGPHDVLLPDEGVKLLQKFSAATENARKAFSHRTGLQRKEMLKALEARKAKWIMDDEARVAEYRRLNPGLKTEEFAKQSDTRRAEFLKGIQEEQQAFDVDVKAKAEKLEKDLKWRESEAKRLVTNGERPPRELWP